LTTAAEHVGGQLIPAGLLVTVPEPLPAVVTDSVNVDKVVEIDTVRFAVIERRQTRFLPEGAQAPPQPLNVVPPVRVTVSLTTVPFTNDAVHTVPQLIPPGLLVTVAVPVPDFVTVSVRVLGEKLTPIT
jgi:hypothetical protein